jgi:WD40 repeat protein
VRSVNASDKPNIFISYAHRDGGDLAGRLQRDLEARGFDVWLDRTRLKGGDRWTNAIETALNRAEVTIALLSEGSYTSDICRAEQGWSLDARKRVIPVKVQRDCPVQIRLCSLQWIDFSDPNNYPKRLEHLLESIAHASPMTAPERTSRHNNSPPLPANFVDRPEILLRLRDALFQEDRRRNIALTALAGMGGIGKTVLALALCRDEIVQQAYPDGIFWFRVGKEAPLRFDERIESIPTLKQLLGHYSGEEACVNQYREALRDRAMLIVLDDVWRAADVEPFRTESPRSRLMVTTRDTSIAPTFGAREFRAELPTVGEAREVLARWAGIDSQELPSQARDIIREAKSLPLALAMIGAQLNNKPNEYWDVLLDHLRHADLSEIKAQFPPPHSSLFRAIHISFEALQEEDPIAAQRYLRLAVLLEDMAAAAPVLQALWNVGPSEALETAERLVGLSLAQRGEASGEIRLHDLQLDYLRAQFRHPGDLRLILEALRLSAHAVEKDPQQFPSQMVGRLLPVSENLVIRQFIDEITVGAPRPWLRPITPGLHPPGTPLLRTLAGHSHVVKSVAVTPDGQRAVSGSFDDTIKVWDLETGRVLCTLSGHSDDVLAVVVTHDGRHAVSASDDHTLKVWDLETGHAIRTLEGHSGNVADVALTPDGKRAISASMDGTLKVWDLRSGHMLRTLEGHSEGVEGIAVTQDGKRAVSASIDRTLKVWNLANGRLLRTMHGHVGAVRHVALTPDGKRAVSASSDNQSDDYRLLVWDLDTGRILHTLDGHTDGADCVAITPAGDMAVSGSQDHTLKIWNLATGQLLRTLYGHSSIVESVAVTPDGKRVVSASGDWTLKLWDLTRDYVLQMPERHFSAVKYLSITADGRQAVSASEDRTLRVWDLATGRVLRTLRIDSGDYLRGIALTPDGKGVVNISSKNELEVLNLRTGRVLRKLRVFPDAVDIRLNSLAITPNGRRAVIGNGSTLIMIDLRTGLLLRTFVGHYDPEAGYESEDPDVESGWVACVALTRDGKRAISGSSDRTLKVWSLANGRELRTLKGHSSTVYGVKVTPDDKWVVSASHDRTLKIWSLENGLEVRTLEGHDGYVADLAVTADGRRLVSASADRTIRVWDFHTGLPVVTFQCEGSVNCCTVAAQGSIVVGDGGGRVYLLALEE